MLFFLDRHAALARTQADKYMPDCIPRAARGSAGNRQPALLPVIASGCKPRGNPVFQFKHEHMLFFLDRHAALARTQASKYMPDCIPHAAREDASG